MKSTYKPETCPVCGKKLKNTKAMKLHIAQMAKTEVYSLYNRVEWKPAPKVPHQNYLQSNVSYYDKDSGSNL